MTSDIPLTIRLVETTDAKSLYDAACSSRIELEPWLPWCHAGYRIEDSIAWLEEQQRLRESGDEYQFALINSEGVYCGGCGLNAIDKTYRRANLGYWVRTSHARRGLASSAVRLLALWAFERTDLNRLEIVVSTDNLASLKVAEKAGAEREGIARERLFLHGRSHDAVVYSIVRSRWT